jgi:hypothetical protein
VEDEITQIYHFPPQWQKVNERFQKFLVAARALVKLNYKVIFHPGALKFYKARVKIKK